MQQTQISLSALLMTPNVALPAVWCEWTPFICIMFKLKNLNLNCFSNFLFWQVTTLRLRSQKFKLETRTIKKADIKMTVVYFSHSIQNDPSWSDHIDVTQIMFTWNYWALIPKLKILRTFLFTNVEYTLEKKVGFFSFFPQKIFIKFN